MLRVSVPMQVWSSLAGYLHLNECVDNPHTYTALNITNYTVHCTQYTIHCTLYIVHYTILSTTLYPVVKMSD